MEPEPDTKRWEDPERISSEQAAAAARQLHASTGVLPGCGLRDEPLGGGNKAGQYTPALPSNSTTRSLHQHPPLRFNSRRRATVAIIT